MDKGNAGDKSIPTATTKLLLNTISSAERESLLLKWSGKGFIKNEPSNESNSRKRKRPDSNQPSSSTSISSIPISQANEVEPSYRRALNDFEDGNLENTSNSNGIGSGNDENANTSFFEDSDMEVIYSRVNTAQIPESGHQEDFTDCEVEIVLNDEVPEKKSDKPKVKICHRCPTKEIGTFTNIEKFWVHSQRHTMDEHFNCVTCGRSFTTINQCLAHEIAVHDTKMESHVVNYRDPVIARARKYSKEKQAKRATGNESEIVGESGDQSFDDKVILNSTTVFRYRGPPVSHHADGYEIWANHARPRFISNGRVAYNNLVEQEEKLSKDLGLNITRRFLKKK